MGPHRVLRVLGPFVVALLFASACSNGSNAMLAAPAAAPAPTVVAEAVRDPTADMAVVEAAELFLRAQSSAAAADMVEAIDQSRDPRWVPWLIDLLRLQVSSTVSTRIGEVLEAITGLRSGERIPNLISYGSWAASNQLDGGDGYRAFKVALYERIDPQFGPLLDSVDDGQRLASIQWGGVPVGGIPELNDPERVPGVDADWMIDDEIVFGVTINGAAVAYPLRILARHELANDTIGGEPVAVVYCTLCKSVIVFDRVVAGQRVRFLTSGLLANSNKIMVDVETNTLWSHLRGVGIGGVLVGEELDRRSVSIMRWSDWRQEQPETSVLALPQPIFFDDPERPPIAYDYTPGAAYASYYDNPDVWFPIIDTPDTFALKTEVVGIEANGDALALSVAELNERGAPLEVEVGGETFRFEPNGAGVRVLTSDGDLAIVEQSFWFAWFANHPETRTLQDW